MHLFWDKPAHLRKTHASSYLCLTQNLVEVNFSWEFSAYSPSGQMMHAPAVPMWKRGCFNFIIHNYETLTVAVLKLT